MPNDEKRLLDLALQIQKGNLDAFDELYELTKRMVFFTSLSIVHDQALAQDVMQDTYGDFLKRIASFKGSETVTAYLARTAHNKAINLVTKRDKEVLLDAYDNEDMYGSEEKEEDEGGTVFKLAKECLSADEYQVTIMHAVNEMKFRQIAQALNKPIGTVLWLYNKAMKTLKEKLGGEENNEEDK